VAISGTVLVATALTVQPIVRYLHATSWLALFSLGILGQWISVVARKRRNAL
jgi:hypothetical protein